MHMHPKEDPPKTNEAESHLPQRVTGHNAFLMISHVSENGTFLDGREQAGFILLLLPQHVRP